MCVIALIIGVVTRAESIPNSTCVAMLASAAELHSFAVEARQLAARVLLEQRAAVIDLVVATTRMLAEDDAPIIESALRTGCRRLLDLGEDEEEEDLGESPADAAVIAKAAKSVATRVQEARLTEEPLAAMRCALLQLSAEAESYAWAASGGLL